MSASEGDPPHGSSEMSTTAEVTVESPVSPRPPSTLEGAAAAAAAASVVDEFYLRYYLGHRGRFGHEFMEFELYPGGKLRYCNSSNYKHGDMIRKECFVSPAVVDEVKRRVMESKVVALDDGLWPEPDDIGGAQDSGRQELECKIGKHHIAFTTRQIGSITDIERSNDPDGLRTFYHLTQDLKELVLALISCHFKARPI